MSDMDGFTHYEVDLMRQNDQLKKQLTEAHDNEVKLRNEIRCKIGDFREQLERAEKAEADRDKAINGTLGCLCCYSVAQENKRLLAKVNELQDFAIWMTGCGYDFAALPYFREQRDKLLLDYNSSDSEQALKES